MATTAGSPVQARIAVFGSANADLVIAVARRPGAGETVHGGALVVTPGGKGANQAVAAARLGARVHFVGCVGDDEHGRLLRSSLRAAGVDDALLRTGSAPTGTAVVLVTPDGDNSIVVSPGANGQVSSQDVEAAGELLGRVRVLVLQREVDPEASAGAAAITENSGGRVMLSLSPSGPVPQRLLRMADPLVVNEQEALDLIGAGSGSGEDSARAILARGARTAVITLGADGAVAADRHGVVRVGAPKVRVVDTTGAGDALTGALAWRLAAGDELAEALRIAIRVAAVSVTRAGAQPSYPTAADLGASLP
jgi:ribokinase